MKCGDSMDNKLTREEVLHVAHLARIGLSEEEIPKYQESLKKMIDEIDKIKTMSDFDEEYMISPCTNEVPLENNEVNNIQNQDILKNVPKKKGNFIEVPVMVNE